MNNKLVICIGKKIPQEILNRFQEPYIIEYPENSKSPEEICKTLEQITSFVNNTCNILVLTYNYTFVQHLTNLVIEDKDFQIVLNTKSNNYLYNKNKNSFIKYSQLEVYNCTKEFTDLKEARIDNDPEYVINFGDIFISDLSIYFKIQDSITKYKKRKKIID